MVLVRLRHLGVVADMISVFSDVCIARSIWAQAMASVGLIGGWDCLLTTACIAQVEQVREACVPCLFSNHACDCARPNVPVPTVVSQLIPQLPVMLRWDSYGELLRVLVARGLVQRALRVAATVSDGACDSVLWMAVQRVYRLDISAVLASISASTLDVVLQVRVLIRKVSVLASHSDAAFHRNVSLSRRCRPSCSIARSRQRRSHYGVTA